MIFAILAAFLFAPPDATAIIRKAVAVQKEQEARNWKFTWRQDYEQIDIDKNGKVFGKKLYTSDVIMLEGSNYTKLILIDGKPLDEKMQKKVDQELEQERSNRREHSTPKKLVRSWSMSGLSDLESLFDNKLTGEETIAGRKTWRVESEPKKDHKPASKSEEQIMGTRRVTWFDQEEGFEVKHETTFVRPVEGNQPGTVYTTLYSKVGDAWLPVQEDHKVEFKALGMIHAWGEHHFRMYDYKRFEVETKITVQ